MGWVTVNKTWIIHSSVYLYLCRVFLALFSSPPTIFLLPPLLCYVPINYKSENIHEQMTGSGMLLACHARSLSLNYSVLYTEYAIFTWLYCVSLDVWNADWLQWPIISLAFGNHVILNINISSLSFLITFSIFVSACPSGFFKTVQGDEKCLQCPINSRTTNNGATNCVCRNGYYRTDSDPLEMPCTSAWLIHEKPTLKLCFPNSQCDSCLWFNQ